MFYFQLLRNQWALLSIFAGIILMLLMVVTYFDMWRPRRMKNDISEREKSFFTKLLLFLHLRSREKIKTDNPEEPDTDYIPMLKAIPWSLWIIYIVLTVWGLVYTVYLIFNPPNW